MFTHAYVNDGMFILLGDYYVAHSDHESAIFSTISLCEDELVSNHVKALSC